MTNDILEATIAKDPESLDAWQEFGEWLSENGDPRGELIILELGGGSERVAQITDANQSTWAGAELATLMARVQDEADEPSSILSLSWKYGFIRSVRVSTDWDSADFVPASMLQTVLRSPAAKFIQEICVGLAEADGENAYDDITASLADQPVTRSVRKLHLGDFEYPDEMEISWSYVGNISSLYTIFPNLEDLHLTGANIELGEIALPKLKRLKLETGGLPAGAIRSVVGAQLPELRDLELWFGDEGYGAQGNLDMIRPLLDGIPFPKLRRLGLMNSEFSDSIAHAMGNAPVLPQLEELSFAMGTLSPEGGTSIVEEMDKYRHLKKLDLSDNFIVDPVFTQLADGLPGIVDLDSQDSPDDYIYVSVSE